MLTDWPPCATTTTPLTEVTTHLTLGPAGEERADGRMGHRAPRRLTDQATYADSTRPSAGIRHVLVNGAFVVRAGSIVPDARPGRPLRAEPR